MLIIKTLHIFFVISWFACLFYLPRLFVNNAMLDNPEQKQLLNGMQARLIKMMKFTGAGTFISAVALVFILSGGTSFSSAFLLQKWLIVKIVLVFLLYAYQDFCIRLHKRFERNENDKSHVWYRWFNEVPALMLLIIVYLVVARPF
ncbi:CopD family protein [Marinicella sp. W31]|uniref:CopD family protein n=1 Tax=Marinicella sp. W31 TaxID=3023713 RepID=UPI0037583EBF